MKEETVRAAIRLPKELYWSFQEERARRHLSNEEAYLEAVQQWIERASGIAAVPPARAARRAAGKSET